METSLYDMRNQVRSVALELRDEYKFRDEAEDAVGEKADSLLPGGNWMIIQEWVCIPDYDADDYSGDPDIIAQMIAALYEWYRDALLGELDELDWEESDEDE